MFKKRFKRMALLIAAVLLCFLCMAPAASAANDAAPGIKGSEAFEGLSGNGKYLGGAYREDYALDTEELGFMDALEKAGTYLANVLLDLDTKLAFMGLQLFHTAMQLNIAEVAGDQLNTIQQALKNSIFEPLFIVGFIGVAWALIKKLLYRNLTGIMAELAKVVLIIVFVAMLGSNTTSVLSNVGSVTRDLGMSVVMQINGKDADGDPEAFAAETVGILWNDLIHQPWLNLEFQGAAYTDSDVDAILSKTPYSDDRQEVINDYIEAHPGTFAKESAWLRLGTLLIYTVVMLIKLAVYVACSAVMLAFQLLAIFYALLGVVIMILAMFESFGGIYLITDWVKKMMETQVMILVTTMLMGLLIWFGDIMRFLDGTLGWLAGMLLQTVIIVIVFVFRKQIFHSFQRMARNPGNLPQKMLAASPAGAASSIYREHRMEQDRKRTVQYQMGAMELQRAQLSHSENQYELVEKQKETADLRNEKLRQDLERREEARQRREAREAAAAEKASRQREQKAAEAAVSRPVTAPDSRSMKAEPEEKPAAPEVQRPVTTAEAGKAAAAAKAASTIKAREQAAQQRRNEAEAKAQPPEAAVHYPEHTENAGKLPDTPEQSPDYIRERQIERPAEPQREAAAAAAAHPRPVTTAPAAPTPQGGVRDTAAAVQSQVPRPAVAGAAPEKTPAEAPKAPQTPQTASKAPQSHSERREAVRHTKPAETRRTPQTASHGPVRPIEDHRAPESAVQRPAMQSAPAPQAAKAQTTPKPAAAPAKMPPAAAQTPAAPRQAPQTHRDLAAARAERKQAQAERTTAAGAMRYDRPTAQETPQGVARPDAQPTDRQGQPEQAPPAEAEAEKKTETTKEGDPT